MIKRRMENDKLEELKSYFNIKFNEQEESLTKTFNNIIANLKKEITKEIQHEVTKQCKQLYSENKILKKPVPELRELNINNRSRNEELQQYGKRLCVRIDYVSKCKSVIVSFTTFWHRTLFYRVRKNLKSEFKLKLNLTKSRFNILKKSMIMSKKYQL